MKKILIAILLASCSREFKSENKVAEPVKIEVAKYPDNLISTWYMCEPFSIEDKKVTELQRVKRMTAVADKISGRPAYIVGKVIDVLYNEGFGDAEVLLEPPPEVSSVLKKIHGNIASSVAMSKADKLNIGDVVVLFGTIQSSYMCRYNDITNSFTTVLRVVDIGTFNEKTGKEEGFLNP